MVQPVSPAPARFRGVVALCFGVAMLEGYDLQVVGIAAPTLVPALHLAAAKAGAAFSASALGLMLGAVVLGWLADRVGPRVVLAVSVLVFGLFSLLTVMATDFPSLFLYRFATGLGIGGAMPNLVAVAARIAAPERRVGVTVAIFAGTPLGGAAVALISALGLAADWRWLFAIGGVLPLVVAPLLWWGLKDAPAQAPVVEAETRRGSGILRTLFAEGRWAPSLLLSISYLCTLVVMYLLLNWLPTLAVAKGLTKPQGALVSVAFNLAGTGTALAFSRGVDRSGFRWPLTIAYGLLIASTILLARADSFGGVALSAALVGAFVLGSQYVLYGVSGAYYPAAGRGAGVGVAVALGRLGSVTGPLLAGALLTSGAGPAQVIGALTPFVVVAGAAVLALSFLRTAEPT